MGEKALAPSPVFGNTGGMDILDTFRTDVRSKRGRLTEVADGSGVKLKTLRNILYRETENPRYDTVEKLRAFYQRRRETD